MLVRLLLLVMAALAHLVAYYAALGGLLFGIVTCLEIVRRVQGGTGFALGIGAMVACASVGYRLQELLPKMVSDP